MPDASPRATAPDATPRRDRPRRQLALALMAASGFASLGYQIVWTQQCALWLGHESAAVLAVVAAFFGGLAVGALALGARIERSARPGRWYAGCEAAIGVWSVALAFLIAPVSEGLLQLIGAQPSAPWQWTVAFFGSFALLLPATAAMGATLPAMERVMALRRDDGNAIAALYAGNTAGAVVGVLVAAFWLVPAFGLARTAAVCALLNGASALAAWRVFDRATVAAPRRSTAASTGSTRILACLAATGLLGIGYEVLVVRVLSQVAENTVYTFAMLLAVYLIGSAVGAALYARFAATLADADRLRDRLLWWLALACLAGTATLWQADRVAQAARQVAGAGMGVALGAEVLIAVAAFLLPTVAMGALFSHLARQARAAGIGFGRALGANTIGAAFAPLLFGVVTIPVIGAKGGLLLIAAGYLALTARRAWATPPVWGAALAWIALAVVAPPLIFVDVPEGGHVVRYREGAMAAVSVVEDGQGVSRLRIDNRQQEGSSSSGLADGRQALLPLLLHPHPQRALFLGLGTGATASAAAADPSVQVDAVELLPEVIEASALFSARRANDTGATSASPLHLMAADARRFVRASGERYDVIVSDNFHPARSGSGALYTVEHFGAVKARLADGGLFCQWLPLHQLDRETLRSIVRAFVAVYPDAIAMLATNSLDTPVLGLVARTDGRALNPRRLRERLATATVPGSPADVGLDDEFALLGSVVAGPRALARFAGDAPLNTDDRPVVAYTAPRITYAPDSLPRDRLVALLHELDVAPGELVDDADFGARLAAYRSARDRFLEAGRDVRPVADVHRMLAQVREPLLSVLRTSPDFRPAYDPLLRMAVALGRDDEAAERALLAELVRAQPARPEAAQLLRERGAAPR